MGPGPASAPRFVVRQDRRAPRLASQCGCDGHALAVLPARACDRRRDRGRDRRTIPRAICPGRAAHPSRPRRQLMPASRVTIDEIARATGAVKTTIQRRAKREDWNTLEETTRGGRRHLYDVTTLPADVREAIVRRMASVAPAPASKLPAVAAAAPSGLKD